MTAHRALLLDVGRVILDVSPKTVEAYDAAVGPAASGRAPAAAGHGPGPAPEGEAPWDGDAALEAVARTRDLDGIPALFRAVAEVVPDQLFVPEAVALMRDARAAGRLVGILSNDAYTFVGRAFFSGRPEFAALDAFVDSTDVGARKPAPEAYLAAADALGVPAREVVFLDDTPECVSGARQVGMAGVLVDPRHRMAAFDRARELLDLTPRPTSPATGPVPAPEPPTPTRGA